MGIIDAISKFIKASVHDVNGKVSSSRISAYFILGGILTSNAIFIGIDIGNAIVKWNQNSIYEVPIDHIALFSMILAHHLVLLGLKRGSDIKAMELAGQQSTTNTQAVGQTHSTVDTSKKDTSKSSNVGDDELEIPNEPPQDPPPGV